MASQRHVIGRQIVELQIARQSEAWPVQQRFSQHVQRRLLPILEKCCDEAVAADQLYRVSRLELDLGTVDASQLEAELPTRVRQAMRAALARCIRELDREAANKSTTTATESRTEVLTYFLQCGSLPWWVDRTQSGVLNPHFDGLLHDAPGILKDILAEAFASPASASRVVGHFDDGRLAQAAAIHAKALSDLAQTVSGGWGRAAPWLSVALKRPTPRLRQSFWESLFQVAPAAGSQSVEASYEGIVRRWASRLGVSAAELIAVLVTGDSRPAVTEAASDAANSAEKGLASRSSATQGGRTRGVREILGRVRQKLEPAARSSRQSAEREAPNAAALGRRFKPSASSKPNPSALTEEAVYLENAGLVVLWPFLRPLFEGVGWVAEGQFIGAEAQHKAVLFLGWLANGSRPEAEYELPLNKVLCGLEPDELCELESDETGDEAQIAEDFLASVIEQAPILNRMSVAGFRGSFLLRNGSLSRRDHMWLLRVERATHDVVLDRFPWTVQWVKLPWMPVPLQVEW